MKHLTSSTWALALAWVLGAAACGGKQQPVVQTTTHTETTDTGSGGQHSKTDSETQHTVKQDGTQIDKTTTTTTAVTPPGN